MNLFGTHVDAGVVWGIAVTLATFAASILVAIIVARKGASRKQAEELLREVAEMKVMVKALFLHVDGLPRARKRTRSAFREGVAAMKESRWADALVHFENALRRARSSQRVALLTFRAECEHRLGRDYVAQRALEEALELATWIGDTDGRLTSLAKLVLILAERDLIERAVSALEEAMQLASGSGREATLPEVLDQATAAFIQAGDYPTAFHYVGRGLSLAQQHGDRKHECSLMARMALILKDRSKYEEALQYAQTALTLSRETTQETQEVCCLGYIGDILVQKCDFESAVSHYQAALTIVKRMGNREMISFHNGRIADVMERRGDFNEAERLHLELLAEYEQIGSEAGAWEEHRDLAWVYSETGRISDAIKQCQQALESSRKTGDQRSVGRDLLALGQVHRHAGDLATAEECLQAAQGILRNFDDPDDMSSVHLELGLLHLQAGKAQDAATLLEESLRLARQAGSLYGEAHTLRALGAAKLALGRCAESLRDCVRAHQLFVSAGMHRPAAGAFAGLTKIHRLLGRAGFIREAMEAGLSEQQASALVMKVEESAQA
jgi:tetratricopeptide (TPR) repeat protein